MIKPSLRQSMATILATGLLMIGLWHVGHGAWIYLKAQVAQNLFHRAWTRTVAGESQVKPWPWADTWPVARLRMPEHDVDLIVLAGASGRTLAFGPGHVSASALPGDAGLSILTAHRDTHFRFLSRVRPGDEIAVEIPNGKRYGYRIRDMSVVDSRMGVIKVDGSQPRLALITCYPFDTIMPGGSMRFVVMAE